MHPNDFRSIWELAHLWEDEDADKTDPAKLPEPVVDKLQKLIWGYFNRQLLLRKTGRWRVPPQDVYLWLFNLNRIRVRLGDIISEGAPYDKKLLSGLFVRRAQVLKWCAEEYIAPPKMWAPPAVATESGLSEDDSDDWYDKLSDKRRQRVTSVEIARQIWKGDPNLSYKEVYKHSAMREFGFAKYVTLERFKRWTSRFASEKAKQKGRRPNLAEKA